MIEPVRLAAAEGLILRNRNTVRWLFPVVGAALLGAAQQLGLSQLSALALSPPLLIAANLVMLAPLAVGLLGMASRRALLGLGVLTGYAYLVELMAVSTGYPYGSFRYLDGLEPLLFGLVPIALPLFWLPMAVNGYLLATSLCVGRLSDRRTSPLIRREGWPAASLLVVVAAGATAALDVVLDPGAVALGFWAWDTPGAFYGVPAVNFLGWLQSSLGASAVLAATVPAGRLVVRAGRFAPIFDTLTAYLLFWGLVNAVHRQWLPVLVAAALWGLASLAARRAGRSSPRLRRESRTSDPDGSDWGS